MENEKNKQRMERTQVKLDNKNLLPIHHKIELDVLEFIDISNLKATEFIKNKDFIKNTMIMNVEKADEITDIIEELGFSPLKVVIGSKQFNENEFVKKNTSLIIENISNSLKEAFKDTDINSLSKEEVIERVEKAREISLANI